MRSRGPLAAFCCVGEVPRALGLNDSGKGAPWPGRVDGWRVRFWQTFAGHFKALVYFKTLLK